MNPSLPGIKFRSHSAPNGEDNAAPSPSDRDAAWDDQSSSQNQAFDHGPSIAVSQHDADNVAVNRAC
jgi:hypothetical protein